MVTARSVMNAAGRAASRAGRLPRRYLRALRMTLRAARVRVMARELDVISHEIDPPRGVVVTNPSVVVAHGRRLVAAREVGYRLRSGRRKPMDGADGYSHTWLYGQSGGATPPVRLADGPATEEIGTTGLEDPRLFVLDGSLMALWTTGDNSAEVRGGYTNHIVLGEVVGTTIRCRNVLASPHGHEREKNWMPFTIADRLHVMYDISLMEVYEVHDGELRLDNRLDARIPELEGLSGSSQLIPWGDDHWLCICHRAIRNAPVRFIPHVFYVHHFVLITRDYQLSKISPEFFFSSRGVEFCAGIAVDGDTVLMSYGENDGRAMLMETTCEQVELLLA